MPRIRDSRRLRALSLVELLVVIGIIAVMVAMLFTTFGLLYKTVQSFR